MKPKIRIEISGKANRELLEEFLAGKYEISNTDFDLLIIDEMMLKMKREEVKKLRSGTFLPVLLVAREKVEEDVWELVDDVIRIPLQKAEFLKRIEMLETIGIRDFLGSKCYKIFHKKEEPIEICPVLAMLKTGKIETREMEIPALGGNFVVTTTPIMEDGKLKKIIHIAVDVTQLRETEKELKSLFSEVSRLNELLRVIYRVNRQMVKKKDFRDIIEDLVRGMSNLGECAFTFETERSCVRRAIEKKEVIREHLEDCKFYQEHKEKQVMVYPMEIDSEVGALFLIAERIRESEFELIKTLLEDIEFVKEKLKLEEDKMKLLEQLQENINEIALLVDGIRNPLAAIFAYTELFADENLREKIYLQVSRIDRIISRLDRIWIESEKLKNLLDARPKL